MADEDMLLKLIFESVPEGRYAVDPDEDRHKVVFYRITKTGKNSRYTEGTLILQRQASEQWMNCYSYLDGQVSRRFRPQDDKYLQELLVYYKKSALEYAVLLEECARCGIKLTDPDSRYNMVGPECIKHWPWMVELAAEWREAQAVKGR